MLYEYLLFTAKTFTILIGILIVFAGILAIAGKGKTHEKGKLEVKKLNKKYEHMQKMLRQEVLDKTDLKHLLKQEKKTKKLAKKLAEQPSRKRVFVIDFTGDIRATGVKALREEITAIIMVATPQDQVVVRLESPGGLVHAYGLASSELRRIRNQQIPLTVIIDKVAASGGYMMAAVADHILAAPFAVIGSIGVIVQLPNFNRLLKKNNVEFEQITAGQFKRTLTLFGENTRQGRQKLQEEVDETQELFKSFITENRPIVDIQQVATGEHWYGTQALKLKLIDEITTSDDYLLNASKDADVYEVSYTTKKGLMEKLSARAGSSIKQLLLQGSSLDI